MGRGGRSVTQRSRFVLVVPHVAFFYSTGVEHCGSVRYCLRFRLDFPKNNCLVLGVSMNEAVPAAPSSVESMAKQGCEKLGLESFDALVRRARTCRRFDESMRVPREFLLELAELAHLAPCGANAQRLRFHVVSDVEECSSLFEKLTWLVRSRIGRVPMRANARPATSQFLPSAPFPASPPRYHRGRHGHRGSDDDARRAQRNAPRWRLACSSLYAPRNRCHGAR